LAFSVDQATRREVAERTRQGQIKNRVIPILNRVFYVVTATRNVGLDLLTHGHIFLPKGGNKEIFFGV
jgi:hypothetical protein